MKKLILLLLVALTLFPLAAAIGGSPGGGGGGGGSYSSDLKQGSRADAYYELYSCAKVALGEYANVYAKAITDSWPSKSRYMAHSSRLYINGQLEDRVDPPPRSISGASETNYFTSISTATVSGRIACPTAVVADFEAKTWHKGISIDDESESFYEYDSFDGGQLR